MSTSNLPTPQLAVATDPSDRESAVTLLPLVDAAAGEAGSCCGGSCSIG